MNVVKITTSGIDPAAVVRAAEQSVVVVPAAFGESYLNAVWYFASSSRKVHLALSLDASDCDKVMRGDDQHVRSLASKVGLAVAIFVADMSCEKAVREALPGVKEVKPIDEIRSFAGSEEELDLGGVSVGDPLGLETTDDVPDYGVEAESDNGIPDTDLEEEAAEMDESELPERS